MVEGGGVPCAGQASGIAFEQAIPCPNESPEEVQVRRCGIPFPFRFRDSRHAPTCSLRLSYLKRRGGEGFDEYSMGSQGARIAKPLYILPTKLIFP